MRRIHLMNKDSRDATIAIDSLKYDKPFEMGVPEKDILELKFIDVKDKNPEKSIEGKVLDELELHKYCCRRMMLGNVHIISYLS